MPGGAGHRIDSFQDFYIKRPREVRNERIENVGFACHQTANQRTRTIAEFLDGLRNVQPGCLADIMAVLEGSADC